MFSDQLRYEVKLLWKELLLTPLVAVVLLTLFAYLQTILHQDPARTFLSEAEIFLPLAAGIVTGTIVLNDPALELHLTTQNTYRRTSFLRLLMLVATTAFLSCLLISVLFLLHFWYLPPFLLSQPLIIQWLLIQLIWLSPLLWFVGAGLVSSLLLKSSVATSTLLGSIWLTELLFWGPFLNNAWLRSQYLFATTMFIYQGKDVALPPWFFNSAWLIPHSELSGTAVVLLLLGWLLLRNPEGLLKGTNTE